MAFSKIVSPIPGLSVYDNEQISLVLAQFPEVSKAILFGSRAKGNFKKASDIDLSIKGQALNNTIIAKINLILNEETSLPYFFDVIHYESLKNIQLKEHIDRVGIVIYTKI